MDHRPDVIRITLITLIPCTRQVQRLRNIQRQRRLLDLRHHRIIVGPIPDIHRQLSIVVNISDIFTATKYYSLVIPVNRRYQITDKITSLRGASPVNGVFRSLISSVD